MAFSWAAPWEQPPTVDRLVIAGGPRVGKTTLARQIAAGRVIIHTDDYIGLAWDDVPDALIREASGYKRYVLEGVRAVWALRSGLQADGCVWLTAPRVELSRGQASLAKATATVFDEWRRSATCPVVPG